jgi:hypothetical protein
MVSTVQYNWSAVNGEAGAILFDGNCVPTYSTVDSKNPETEKEFTFS